MKYETSSHVVFGYAYIGIREYNIKAGSDKHSKPDVFLGKLLRYLCHGDSGYKDSRKITATL
jgi:hypothetical protein